MKEKRTINFKACCFREVVTYLLRIEQNVMLSIYQVKSVMYSLYTTKIRISIKIFYILHGFK